MYKAVFTYAVLIIVMNQTNLTRRLEPVSDSDLPIVS